ncbi:hypothetical protein ACFLRF_05550, partial [Candidatus Altiarchaeota archaeon]
CAAMLVKISTPLYFIGPLSFIIYSLATGRRHDSMFRKKEASWYLVTLLLLFFMLAWYASNWEHVYDFVRQDTRRYRMNDLGLVVHYWATSLNAAFFSSHGEWILLPLMIGGLAASKSRCRDKCSIIGIMSAIQIAAVMTVLTLSSIDLVDRYLYAMLPYFSILIAWSLSRIDKQAVTCIVLGIFFAQYAMVSLSSLGYARLRDPEYLWLRQVDRKGHERALIRRIIEVTCKKESNSLTVISVIRHWLNPPSIIYERYKHDPSSVAECSYELLGLIDEHELGVYDPGKWDAREKISASLRSNATYFITMRWDDLPLPLQENSLSLSSWTLMHHDPRLDHIGFDDANVSIFKTRIEDPADNMMIPEGEFFDTYRTSWRTVTKHTYQ